MTKRPLNQNKLMKQELATDEEEEQPQEEAQQEEAYTTYTDIYSLQGSINDMSNLAESLRDTSVIHEHQLLQLEPRMGSGSAAATMISPVWACKSLSLGEVTTTSPSRCGGVIFNKL